MPGTPEGVKLLFENMLKSVMRAGCGRVDTGNVVKVRAGGQSYPNLFEKNP
jgi:hypothetical protein